MSGLIGRLWDIINVAFDIVKVGVGGVLCTGRDTRASLKVGIWKVGNR